MAGGFLEKAEAALKEQKYEDAVELFTEVSSLDCNRAAFSQPT
jgi:hypothetical protein